MSTTDRSVEVDSDKFWAAVLDYREAWFDADAACIVSELHPKVVKRCRGIEGNDRDVLKMLSIRDMIDATASVALHVGTARAKAAQPVSQLQDMTIGISERQRLDDTEVCDRPIAHPTHDRDGTQTLNRTSTTAPASPGHPGDASDHVTPKSTGDSSFRAAATRTVTLLTFRLLTGRRPNATYMRESLGDGSLGSCRITGPPIAGTNSNREPKRGCPAQGDENGRA